MTMLTLSDDGRTRVVKFNETVYTLSLKDPYGFCMISSDDVKIPEELKSPYTSFSVAAKALEIFENNRAVSTKKAPK